MEKLFDKEVKLNEYSPSTLAFIGDCVFELLVREQLVLQGNRPVGELNRKKVSMVCCKAQASAIKSIMPLLTEQEMLIYKNGRNTHVNVPKNASAADYHSATGLEALFGYLYLDNNMQRIRELYSKIDYEHDVLKGML